MADQRTMAQLLQAPTEGYEDAIVVPAITADNFELKHGLLTLVQNKQFYGLNKEDPHAHLCYFNKITSTLKFPNFFPPSKTTSLRNAITNFQQRFDETFSEAWDRFKDLLRACPHHGFLELNQLDTFYNALNSKDQDSLHSAAGGNFLDKMPCDILSIIQSKSKVRYSRDKHVVARVSMTASTSVVSPDVAELKDLMRALLLDKKGQSQSPAHVKVVEESCVTWVVLILTKIVQPPMATYRPQMMSNQIQPPGFPSVPNNQNVQRNNQNRFITNQNRGNNFNQGLAYQPPVFQQPAYQAPAYQAPAPETQGVSKEDFLANVKANDAVMKNMQTQGTLPSNTIANPKSDLKAITTPSGVSYDGPQIPPPTVQSKPVTSEPAIAPVSDSKPNPKASIPYPSRRNDERNHEKANNQIEKFNQIFKDMSFEISFADALILMPKFASTLKALIGNKEKLSEMAQTPLNEHCSTVLLKKLPKKLGDPGKFLIPGDFPGMAECLALADLGASINLMPLSMWKKLSLLKLTPTCMTLELADRSISRQVRIAKDVTERALIDVFEGELTLRVSKEAIAFNLDQTLRYSANYSDMTAKRIDVIDMACEEYSQEVLGFFDTISSSNPTPCYDTIVFATSLTLTPFRNSDFLLEEVDAFLAVEDEPILSNFQQPYLDPEGDICLLEAFLNDDPHVSEVYDGNFRDMIKKTMEVFMDDFFAFGNSFQSCLSHLEKMLKRCEDTNICLNWEKSHFMVKEGIVLGHKISKKGIEVDKAKVDVISKLPHPTTVKGFRSFLGHAGFYRRFIKDFSKIARPMTRLLEKDTPFIFSKECVDAFQTLKRKLTEAPILIALDWDMSFELMCDANDFAIRTVLGQRQDKHFVGNKMLQVIPTASYGDPPASAFSHCLSQVEARLVEFKTKEIKFCKKIRGLERDVEVRNNKIKNLMNQLEQVKKEKEGLDNKLTGFESASKDLDTLLGSQRTDKNKEGLGYNAVPPLLLKPTPSIDSSKSNTSDFQNSNFSVSEHGESSSSIMSKSMIKFVKAADCPGVIKTNKTKTARKSTVKYVEMYRNTSKSPKVRGNQRN
nr:reverse transcriptase domain-containing protein [Tanacetum cinerariifolium]